MKVAMITGLQPETHYSRYLCHSIFNLVGDNLIVYCDKDKRNLDVKECGKIKLVWDKNAFYWWHILKQLLIDKPDLVHLQHEINMFGGGFTALIFPWFLFCLKLFGFKVVVTVHGVVNPNYVDSDFVSMFLGKKAKYIPILVFKITLFYIYFLISKLANRIIVHTELLKKLYINYYFGNRNNISVYPIGVLMRKNSNNVLVKKRESRKILKMLDKHKYFLYFGYIAGRKGLDEVIKGFAKFNKNNKSNFRLILAGGIIKGQEFSKNILIDLIKKLEISDKVLFTGFVDKEMIDYLFRNAYVVLVPAKISISASAPLAESFGYNKCVLASNVDNLKDEIDDASDGILVNNNEWHKAFLYVSENSKRVRKIEKNVIYKARDRAWPIIAEMNINIYKKLVYE